MGYFSNGSEGDDYETRFCNRCVHQKPRSGPYILGSHWDDHYWQDAPTVHRGVIEISRALLFPTRVLARAWCDTRMAKWAGRQDCMAKWRVRPVRVRETVRMV